MTDREGLGSDSGEELAVVIDRTAPLLPGESVPVARWVGRGAAAVVDLEYHPEAEPGREYEVVLWAHGRAAGGRWEVQFGAGSDFPMVVPGDRPRFREDGFPVVGINLWGRGGDGSVFTFGVATAEVVSLEIRDRNGGLTRSEVGAFGVVVIASEAPPAEVVALDADGKELGRSWHLRSPS